MAVQRPLFAFALGNILYYIEQTHKGTLAASAQERSSIEGYKVEAERDWSCIVSGERHS